MVKDYVHEHTSTMEADIHAVYDDLLKAIKNSKIDDWNSKSEVSSGVTEFYAASLPPLARTQRNTASASFLVAGGGVVLTGVVALMAWRRTAATPKPAPASSEEFEMGEQLVE